jgi:RNA polymerase sigma factor (sigma-70 family)
MLTDIQDDTYIDGMDDEDAFNLYASITNEKFNSNLRDASNKIAKKDLLKVMETILTEREYFVLKSHFFDEMMLADIAKVIGLTAQGVRIIELKALQKIRYRGLAMKRLEGYLDDFY